MKKRILLIDGSLTVQKVVSLTLDKGRYHVVYAKSRVEAVQQINEATPDVILVSDQVTDITIPSFPKELETWLGRTHEIPPIVLITAQDIKEIRHYAGVLKKPFSPQALQALVQKFTLENPTASGLGAPEEDFEDQRLQKIFNDTFNDEANLVRATFENEIEQEDVTQVGISTQRPSTHSTDSGSLWAAPAPAPRPAAPPARPAPARPAKAPVMGAEDSMAYKAVLEREVEGKLSGRDLDEMVDKLLNKLVPPIVERLVQERLDKLMKEQDDYQELKPTAS